ncbi:MAG: permease prefix domain 1-containing protein [Vicinamibacteria bacterium]
MRDDSRHPAIEAFLAQVEARLGALSPEERAEERAELAHHLDLLVTANRAGGMDPDDAVHAAVGRFGRAGALGAALAAAGRARRTPVREALLFVILWTVPVVTGATSDWYVDGVLFPHPWIDGLYMLAVVTVAFFQHRQDVRAAAQ